MQYIDRTCFMCTCDDYRLINVTAKKGNKNDIFDKFIFLLPELAILKGDIPLYICESCHVAIESFYAFKKMCLENYIRWKENLKSLVGATNITNQKFFDVKVVAKRKQNVEKLISTKKRKIHQDLDSTKTNESNTRVRDNNGLNAKPIATKNNLQEETTEESLKTIGSQEQENILEIPLRNDNTADLVKTSDSQEQEKTSDNEEQEKTSYNQEQEKTSYNQEQEKTNDSQEQEKTSDSQEQENNLEILGNNDNTAELVPTKDIQENKKNKDTLVNSENNEEAMTAKDFEEDEKHMEKLVIIKAKDIQEGKCPKKLDDTVEPKTAKDNKETSMETLVNIIKAKDIQEGKCPKKLDDAVELKIAKDDKKKIVEKLVNNNNAAETIAMDKQEKDKNREKHVKTKVVQEGDNNPVILVQNKDKLEDNDTVKLGKAKDSQEKGQITVELVKAKDSREKGQDTVKLLKAKDSQEKGQITVEILKARDSLEKGQDTAKLLKAKDSQEKGQITVELIKAKDSREKMQDTAKLFKAKDSQEEGQITVELLKAKDSQEKEQITVELLEAKDNREKMQDTAKLFKAKDSQEKGQITVELLKAKDSQEKGQITVELLKAKDSQDQEKGQITVELLKAKDSQEKEQITVELLEAKDNRENGQDTVKLLQAKDSQEKGQITVELLKAKDSREKGQDIVKLLKAKDSQEIGQITVELVKAKDSREKGQKLVTTAAIRTVTAMDIQEQEQNIKTPSNSGNDLKLFKPKNKQANLEDLKPKPTSKSVSVKDGTFYCRRCNNYFSDREEHNNIKTKCPICNVTIHKHQLNIHVDDHLVATHYYTCSTCHVKFNRRKHFNQHNREHHNKIKIPKSEPKPKNKAEYQCEICNMKFMRNLDLTRHVKVHKRRGKHSKQSHESSSVTEESNRSSEEHSANTNATNVDLSVDLSPEIGKEDCVRNEENLSQAYLGQANQSNSTESRIDKNINKLSEKCQNDVDNTMSTKDLMDLLSEHHETLEEEHQIHSEENQ